MNEPLKEFDKAFMDFINEAEKPDLSKYRNLIVAERKTRGTFPESRLLRIESEEQLKEYFHRVFDPEKQFFKRTYLWSLFVTIFVGSVLVLDVFFAIRHFIKGDLSTAILFVLLAILMAFSAKNHGATYIVSKHFYKNANQVDIDEAANNLYKEYLQQFAADETQDPKELFWSNVITQIKLDDLEILLEKQRLLDARLGLG